MNQILNPLSIKKYWKNQIPPDINYLYMTNQKYTDPYFPPNRNSFISYDPSGFFIDRINGPEFLQRIENRIPGVIDRIIWKRATEFNKNWELIGNNRDILQGNIGDCYFLAALLTLTQYPYIIAEKFRTKNYNEIGYYEMIFFIDGEWQIVFIDDFFPYDPEQEELIGVRPQNNELWAILLEKAWVKINGGYVNTYTGLFSEAILGLTGFPTEIFKHKKIENPNDIYNLYKSIENGYKEGSIMACGTKLNGPGVDIYRLIPGHSYTIICAKKWQERNIFLIKLKNPWGRNEWCGNWSEYSYFWTEELKNYFNYENKDDGTLWIDLNDFINFFDNTYICHILFGALFKYFHFENPDYFKRPAVFNLLIKQRAITSITILFKNFRFNRELYNVIHPFSIILCKYNINRRVEKIWPKWDCEDEEINFVEILESGYYCLWLYCPLNQVKGDNNFKYILQISSLSLYEIEFVGFDNDFSLIQYLLTDNYSILYSNKLYMSPNYLITNFDELCNNGIFNTLIFNKTPFPMELSVVDDGVRNCELFPPYKDMLSFKVIIPGNENAAILALRLSYDSGSFNFKFESIIKTIGLKMYGIPSQYMNIGERFKKFLKFDISNYSPMNNYLRSNQYFFVKKDIAKQLPNLYSNNIYNLNNNYSLLKQNINMNNNDSLLKQNININNANMNIKNEISPNELFSSYPYEFNILFKKFPYDINSNIIKKWTKLYNNKGTFIGQINSFNGELEGRGIFFWNTGIKYIGNFSKNKIHGKGILYNKYNKLIFEGNFFGSKKNGYGCIYSENGEYYEGNFVNDKIEGYGIYHFINGDTWEGIFKNKMKNGVGIMIRKDREIFLVQYENDNFMGMEKLNYEEMNYINNLRLQDKQSNHELEVNSNYKKLALIGAYNLYINKRGNNL